MGSHSRRNLRSQVAHVGTLGVAAGSIVLAGTASAQGIEVDGQAYVAIKVATWQLTADGQALVTLSDGSTHSLAAGDFQIIDGQFYALESLVGPDGSGLLGAGLIAAGGAGALVIGALALTAGGNGNTGPAGSTHAQGTAVKGPLSDAFVYYDANGNGIVDLIIGAYGHNSSAGESYVVFGKNTANAGNFSASFDLVSLTDDDADGSAGFVINGISAGDRSGFSVSSAGDVNGDGIDDLIIGAPDTDLHLKNTAGQSYVVFGRRTHDENGDPNNVFGTEVHPSQLNGSNGFEILGHDDNDNIGFSLSSAGNINGDSFDDLIIGAPSIDDNTGQTYVLLGQDLFEPIVYIGDYLPDM